MIFSSDFLFIFELIDYSYNFNIYSLDWSFYNIVEVLFYFTVSIIWSIHLLIIDFTIKRQLDLSGQYLGHTEI